jgi:hypothetical protein
MGCQTEIAADILAAGADYVLSVKENQPHLLEDISFFFDLAQQNDFTKVDHDYQRTVNGGHGRIALNLLKQEDTAKVGIAAKRRKAGWDVRYLLKVLAVV